MLEWNVQNYVMFYVYVIIYVSGSSDARKEIDAGTWYNTSDGETWNCGDFLSQAWGYFGIRERKFEDWGPRYDMCPNLYECCCFSGVAAPKLVDGR